MGGLTALAVADDALRWFRSEFATGATPQSEMVVSLTLSQGNRYVARASSVYYLADADASLYAAAPAARTLRVKGE